MAKGTVSDPKKSDPKKPVLDEQTLDKLLEAAFVIQEQGDLQQQAWDPVAADLISPSQLSTNKVPATPIAASASAATRNFVVETPSTEKAVAEKPATEKPVPKKSTAQKSAAAGAIASAAAPLEPVGISSAGISSAGTTKDAYTLTLAQIVETQQQILTRRLELENAMALVAQRAAEITGAAGSAIGIVESKTEGQKTDGKKLRYRAVSGLLTLARGSEVAMEKALCFNCLRSGEVIRGADVNSDFLLDAEECRRRGIGSLIAVPIYRDSGIAGALELYFASANAFREQDVHSGQLMAGLVTEALARDAGVSSRKSLAAERATMLEALEKLRPNLAALMESPALKESVARSGAPAATAPIAVVPMVTPAAASASATSLSSANPAVSNAPATAIPKKPSAPAFFCRKCGHELVGEEMFCGKCGSPRSGEYQPPTMQSKVASLWQMQQASKQNAEPAQANGGMRAAERKIHPGVPAEIQPWEAVLSELEDPFGEPEPEAAHELEADWKPAPRTEAAAPLRKEVIEISAAARKFAAGLDAPGEQKSVRAESMSQQSLDARSIGAQAVEPELSKPVSFEADSFETDSFEADAEGELEGDGALLPGRGRPGLPDLVGGAEKAPRARPAPPRSRPRILWPGVPRRKRRKHSSSLRLPEARTRSFASEIRGGATFTWQSPSCWSLRSFVGVSGPSIRSERMAARRRSAIDARLPTPIFPRSTNC